MQSNNNQFFVHMRTELANLISKFEKKHKCHVLIDTEKVGMYVHEEDYLEYLKKNNLDDDGPIYRSYGFRTSELSDI